MENSDTSQLINNGGINKASACNHIVISAGVLIHGDQEGVGLANMDVQIGVVLLWGVGAFGLHKEQVMVLDPEVEACGNTNIVYPKPVRFPWNDNKDDNIDFIPTSI